MQRPNSERVLRTLSGGARTADGSGCLLHPTWHPSVCVEPDHRCVRVHVCVWVCVCGTPPYVVAMSITALIEGHDAERCFFSSPLFLLLCTRRELQHQQVICLPWPRARVSVQVLRTCARLRPTKLGPNPRRDSRSRGRGVSRPSIWRDNFWRAWLIPRHPQPAAGSPHVVPSTDLVVYIAIPAPMQP